MGRVHGSGGGEGGVCVVVGRTRRWAASLFPPSDDLALDLRLCPKLPLHCPPGATCQGPHPHSPPPAFHSTAYLAPSAKDPNPTPLPHPPACPPAIASPRAADLPRPRAAVSATVLRSVFSDAASRKVTTALAWSRVLQGEVRREGREGGGSVVSEAASRDVTTAWPGPGSFRGPGAEWGMRGLGWVWEEGRAGR